MLNQTIFSSFSLLFLTLPISATEIIVQYGQPVQDCHIAVTGAVTIDPQSGNLLTGGTFGTGCPTGNTGGGVSPSITAPLTSSATPATVSQAFTVSWATQNVDYCTTDGSSFTGGASFSQGQWPTIAGAHICDGAACAQPQVSLIAAVAGSGYHFAVKCYKNGSPVQSTSPSILDLTVQSGGGGNPSCVGVSPPAGFTRQTGGPVSIVSPNINRGTITYTDFKPVFGYDPLTPNTLLDWPGAGHLISNLSINGNQYVALQFTVPSGINLSTYATMLHTSGAGANLPFSSSISACPGDFRNDVPYCYVDNGLKAGITAAVTPGLGTCYVEPGKTYYFNIMFNNCTGTCTARINNQNNR